LEPIGLHECRHTFASLLIASGENPKAVQEFMGHSTSTMTFDLYGHLFPGSRDEARARMDAYPAMELAPTGGHREWRLDTSATSGLDSRHHR
jgi:integrase